MLYYGFFFLNAGQNETAMSDRGGQIQGEIDGSEKELKHPH